MHLIKIKSSKCIRPQHPFYFQLLTLYFILYTYLYVRQYSIPNKKDYSCSNF